MNWLTAKRWSPYQVGLLIGVLCWVAFYISDRPLAASAAFAKSAAMIEKAAAPEHYAENKYFHSQEKYAPVPDWQWMLVVGIFAGALFSGLISRDIKPEIVPEVWRSGIGRSAALRLLWAFIGGVALMFGARMAGGCASGHGISGGLQLSVGSWTFLGVSFLTGTVTACLVYRTRRSKTPAQQ